MVIFVPCFSLFHEKYMDANFDIDHATGNISTTITVLNIQSPKNKFAASP